jgi:hypothetical protein
MSSSRSITNFPKIRFARLAPVAILSGCMLLAAPSVGSASKSGSPWDPILQGIGKSVSTPFSAVYQLVDTTKGTPTENESITFAQDPAAKEVALVTPSGSFYLTATKTLACRGQGGHLECTQLPKSLLSAMTSIKNLFAPGVIKTDIDNLELEASAHGYKLTSYSQSYGSGSGGAQYLSNCIKVTGPKMYGPGIFCTSSSDGVLTYSQGSSSSTKTYTITIHAGGYTANPPASTFVPPPGTTIVTIPPIP